MGKGRVLIAAIIGALFLATAGTAPAYTPKTSDKTQVFQGTLVGIVEVSPQGEVYVTTNWRSRSRASYRVTGDLKDQVAQYKGQVTTVEGTITRTSPWSGTIEVEKILETNGRTR